MAFLMSTVLIRCDSAINNHATTRYKYPVAMLVSADISNDASRVAFLSDKELSLWNRISQKQLNAWTMNYFPEVQYHVTLSGNNNVIASAGKKYLTVFDITTNKTIAQWHIDGFSEHAQISFIQLSEKGDKIAIGLNEGSVVWVDFKANKRSLFNVHTGAVKFLEISKNANFLLSASLDGSIKRTKISNGNIKLMIKTSARITSLALNEKETQFFYADALDHQQFIDIKSGVEVLTLHFYKRYKYFRKAIFITKGQILVNSTSKNQLNFWDLTKGNLLGKATISSETFGSTTLDLAVDSKGSLFTVSSDGIIESWRLLPRS